MYAVAVVPPKAWYRQVTDAMAHFSACGKFAPTRHRKHEEVDFLCVYRCPCLLPMLQVHFF